MKKTFAALVALASFASASLASTTFAAQPQDKAPAGAAVSTSGGKTEFANGRARFGAKDFTAALPLFRKAFEASGSPNASLYVGLCLIELNQPVEAYDVLATTAREAEKRMAGDPAYQHTNEVAKEKLGQLEKKVGRVTVTLANAPSGATVVVNDRPLAPEKIGSAFAVTPGKITVVATAAGQPDQRAEITVAAGDDKPVVLRFAGPEAGGSLAPATTIEQGPRSGKMSTMRVAGIAVAGVGVVGFGVMLAAGLSANSKYDDVKAHCNGRCTDPKYADEVSSGKTLDGLANVGLVVGILGVVGGGTLFVLGGKKSEPATALEIGPQRVTLKGTF